MSTSLYAYLLFFFSPDIFLFDEVVAKDTGVERSKRKHQVPNRMADTSLLALSSASCLLSFS